MPGQKYIFSRRYLIVDLCVPKHPLNEEFEENVRISLCIKRSCEENTLHKVISLALKRVGHECSLYVYMSVILFSYLNRNGC